MRIDKRWQEMPAHLLPNYPSPSELAKFKAQMEKSLRDNTSRSTSKLVHRYRKVDAIEYEVLTTILSLYIYIKTN